MAQSGDTSVKTKTVNKNLFDMFAFDGVEVLVLSTLGDDDDALSFSQEAMLMEEMAHLVLPGFRVGRALRDEDVVGSSRHTRHQSQPSTVTAHDFDDKGAGMRGCSG